MYFGRRAREKGRFNLCEAQSVHAVAEGVKEGRAESDFLLVFGVAEGQVTVFEQHVLLWELAVILEWTAIQTYTGKGRDEDGLMRKNLLPLISILPVYMLGFTASAGRGRTFIISGIANEYDSLDTCNTL